MKILSSKKVRGKERVTLELEPGEKLLAIKDGTYYRLGHPLDDVVPSHVVADPAPVNWCPLEQKWLD